ncbi:MAG: rhodanese-like domain-containing protein [Actinomycetota bacterium]|nr:rhodanese-like domain-containing protein [Actinomycetota bacterium]
MEILTVTDEGLGHSSHVVGLPDGHALIIDPSRFPDRQRQLLAERGWELGWTADTHSHADYISGSRTLATEGAVFLAPARAGLEHAHRPVEPGEDVELTAGVVLRALPTPGHTPDHLAYLLVEHGEPVVLFSGGSLMVGTVGRTDLLGTRHAPRLAAQLFRALRDEILTLPDDLPVLPTHGAGSFCSAAAGAPTATTIGAERATNPLLQIDDEHRFVDRIVGTHGSFPTYFRLLPERNQRGPVPHRHVPALPALRPTEVAERLVDGATLVDARPIERFAAGHPAGALSNALRPVFGSWLGWLVPLDTPIVLLLDDDQDPTEAVRQALTVGHEQLVGIVDGGCAAWAGAGLSTATIPLVGSDAASGPGTVIDVRQRSEWGDGHVPGAVHVELGAIADAPLASGPATLMCGHGERAMTAAAILAARGHRELRVLAGGPGDWVAATGGRLATFGEPVR